MLILPRRKAGLDVSQLFATTLYTGNSSTQTITNGLDLAGKGGLVWGKSRGGVAGSYGHELVDTIRGASSRLMTDNSNGASSFTDVSSFSASGYALKYSSSLSNQSGMSMVSWSFCRSPKFFDIVTFSHTNGISTVVSTGLSCAIGMAAIKRINGDGHWFVAHRSVAGGQVLLLNMTVAASASDAIAISGNSIVCGAGNSTGTYVAYIWAHDDSASGIIQCGSFANDGSGNATVNLNWAPQFVMVKCYDYPGKGWDLLDTTRGYSSATNDALLQANVSSAESLTPRGGPTSSGFVYSDASVAFVNFIYVSIRAPS